MLSFQKRSQSIRTLKLQSLEKRELLTCDLNLDGLIDANDVDYFSSAEADVSRLDIDRDGRVTEKDRDLFISIGLNAKAGDSNLDGVFDSSDFVQVFQLSEYEDGIENNSTWKSGDWNGDGEFDSRDFVFAFEKGDYEQDAYSDFEDPGATPRTAHELGILPSSLQINQAYGLNSSCQADNIDFYSFEITTPSSFFARLSEVNDGSGLYILADKNGNGLFESSTDTLESAGGNGNHAVAEDLAPGKYFVAVGRWWEHDASRYTLEINTSQLPSLPSDPGGSIASAYDLGMLESEITIQDVYTHGVDSTDYLRFTVDKPTSVTASLYDLTDGGGIYLFADKNGNGLFETSNETLESTGGNGNHTVSEDLAPGEYFVWVGRWWEDDASRYTLTLTPQELPGLSTDPGESISTATDLGTLNSSIVVQDVVTDGVDSIDYYKFNIETPTSVTVTLSGLTDGGGIYLFADKNGNGLFETSTETLESAGGNGNHTVSEDLAPGTYYIWTGRWWEDDATRYTLSLIPNKLPSLTPDPGQSIATAYDLGILDETIVVQDVFTDGVDTTDYFRFTVERSTSIVVTLSGLTDGGGVYLFEDKNENGKFESSSETLESSGGTGNRTLVEDLSPGTYYLWVGRWWEDDASRYTLRLNPNG